MQSGIEVAWIEIRQGGAKLLVHVVTDLRIRRVFGALQDLLDFLQVVAIVVEFSGPDDRAVRGILAGSARELLPGEPHAERGEGALAPGADAVPHDRSEGEPV
jgi:hypothetical protein